MRKKFSPRASLLAMALAATFGMSLAPGMAFASEADIMKRIEALQAEINQLKAEATAARQQAPAPTPAAAPVPALPEMAGSPVAASFNKGYIGWASADGNYSLKIDGRVQLDVGSVSADTNNFTSDSNFRRVRLGLKTKFWKDWEGEWDFDFAGSQLSMKDMWLAYQGIPDVSIKGGHFKPHFSMDQVTSSRVATYLESSIATEIVAPSRRIGLAADYSNDWMFLGGGVFGNKANKSGDPDSKDNSADSGQPELFGYSLRAAMQPLWRNDNNRVFHVGLNLMNQRPRSQSPMEYDPNVATTTTCSGTPLKCTSKSVYNATKASAKYRSMKLGGVGETELFGADTDVVSARLYGATDAMTTGLELGFKYGPHILTGEYLDTKVKSSSEGYTTSIPDASFNSYYVAYSYFFSGDRVYDSSSAEFAGVSGKNALEFVARYSVADLNDPNGGNSKKFDVTNTALVAPVIGTAGGKATISTVGLNWYPNLNTMFRLDYLTIETDAKSPIGKDKINVLGLRSQFTF